MKRDDITAWQDYLVRHGQKQLFPQMWEPVIVDEVKQDGELGERFMDVVITNKERNAFKKKMKERGINVHAGTPDSIYDYRSGKYIYLNDNTLHVGNNVEIDYTADPERKRSVLHRLTVSAKCPIREFNLIIFEKDRLCLKHSVSENNTSVLTDEVLGELNAMQIDELIQTAIKSKSTKCSAILLDYKNEHFADITMDEFSLD